MGINIKAEETFGSQVQNLESLNSIANLIPEDSLFETLQMNLLVLEGLQNRCSFVLKEIRYLMKIDDNL